MDNSVPWPLFLLQTAIAYFVVVGGMTVILLWLWERLDLPMLIGVIGIVGFFVLLLLLPDKAHASDDEFWTLLKVRGYSAAILPGWYLYRALYRVLG